MWFIAWLSLVSGVIGEGKPVFSTRSECVAAASAMNVQYPDILHVCKRSTADSSFSSVLDDCVCRVGNRDR